MRAVDTNVVVRYLTGDDPEQALKARHLIDHDVVFVTRTVLLEVEWVLRGVYDFPMDRIVPALRGFAGLPGVTVEDAPLAAQALDWAASGMDFADALHLAGAGAGGCDGFATFDKHLVRSAAGVGGIPVRLP